ncbi:MAG: hypothetical protein AAFS10_27730, partial [Myxococcota bacterium]
RLFVPLTAEDEEEEHVGWCSIEHPLDLDLDAYKVFYNEYLNMGMRIDKWRIPTPILKAHYTEAERDYMADNNKERLSRDEKVNLKDMVTAKLKRRFMPSMKVIDMSWNTHTGVLRFWNQSSKTCEQFQALFEDTFQMSLVPQSPYTDALQFSLTDAQVEHLSVLEPSVLHTHGLSLS